MTCIVGLVDKNKIYMAGDHIGSNGYSRTIYNEQKVFIKEDFILGYTSSFRMGQLLQYSWVPPARTDKQNDKEYLILSVVPSIIKLFKDNGFLRTEKEEQFGGTFLLGYKKKLYCFQNDFSLIEDQRGFNACGCGEDFALGALEALSQANPSMPPDKKIQIALSAAERHSALVDVDWARFKVLSL